MMTLITAALVAAQPVPVADAQGQMGQQPHHAIAGTGQQHEAMKDECCCEDMAAKHDGHGAEHGEHGSR
jgi:hypothetical protein